MLEGLIEVVVVVDVVVVRLEIVVDKLLVALVVVVDRELDIRGLDVEETLVEGLAVEEVTVIEEVVTV